MNIQYIKWTDWIVGITRASLRSTNNQSDLDLGWMTDNFYYCENIKSLYSLIWQILFMAGARDRLMDLRSKDPFWYMHYSLNNPLIPLPGWIVFFFLLSYVFHKNTVFFLPPFGSSSSFHFLLMNKPTEALFSPLPSFSKDVYTVQFNSSYSSLLKQTLERNNKNNLLEESDLQRVAICFYLSTLVNLVTILP